MKYVAFIITLFACGDNVTPQVTWGDAVDAWADAWCSRQERCGHPVEDCEVAVKTANCYSPYAHRYPCDDPYPYPPQYFEECAAEVAGESCEPTVKSEFCAKAFKP